MSPPSPSLCLLHSYVRTGLAGDSTEPKVVPLSSGGVQLVGFDGDEEVADSVVSGLGALEAHLAVAPDLSFLTLGGGSMFTSINNVADNLIVIASTFPEDRSREVFFILDIIDRSLRMIPAVPRDFLTNRTYRVLAVPHHGDARSYSLVIPGQAPISLIENRFAEWVDVLLISSSPSSSTPSSSTSTPPSTSPWQTMKRANFPKPELPDNFFADEVFSFSGRGYWADLLCGVMHCDCADVLSDGVDPVEFRFFTLPRLHMTNPLGREVVAELRAFRTMGCVGGSIKFVSIDGFITRVDAWNTRHRNVRVWRLTQDFKWTSEDRLSMQDLWKMPGFQHVQSLFANPHSLVPMYPFLSSKEDRVIYFALGEFTQGHSWGSFPTTVHFLLRVDMCLWDVSFIHIPFSQTPTLQDYFGVDHSSLCPPVALSGDGKAKVRGLKAKMKGLKF